jgi:hypothetical protein
MLRLLQSESIDEKEEIIIFKYCCFAYLFLITLEASTFSGAPY